MESYKINFYKDKININLLAKDLQNAREVVEAIDGYATVGIISKQFKSIDEGVEYVKKFQEYMPALSIGLGDGDPNQWQMAAEIASYTDPGHVNQVFTAAGYTLGLLKAKGCSKTIVNALISPTGQLGKVNISTGAISSKEKAAIVDVDTAIAMLKDVGVESVKYYHMEGDKRLAELKAVAEACVKVNIPMIEPTGGITVENIKPIIETCLNAGCSKIMPHVYSSIIDKSSGLTSVNQIKRLYDVMKEII
ncbi:2-dehydro-3-deoxy-phosphogluconate aldolase [Alkaliphilus peptidifermentans]|uniref:2-dehydro-3-deoxy-phosphogluconate aldolase n=1 Tax=Alkaliphilus peptidifermentans DSM 18978 TaxID=1120976 RepID=A0A1G5ITG0_9FIRM|nr:KDGP aldolase [Alkaliphilus peptidifermentans]SCY78919.1 2-dehydro-3-deoxy-phosphogluconate aldolase [Alkaliphilus peptidifermentans DSM 18978]